MSEADFYREHGYHHARGVFDTAEVEAMRAAIGRILDDVEGTANDENHRWSAAEKETVLKGFHNLGRSAAVLDPYRCLTPRRGEADDLLVPVCMSASHVAFSSVRMEPTYMLLGHAAGLAAAQAARRGVAVQDVDVADLQRSLLEQGQVLSP